ncbi:GDSL esterase/lipase [Hibiscus syriacus]|uniref:GDSL esterase/lipase n=1 Tax=Hibiscus syriacus TaxID=106335 RepID=A0A6A2YGE8_HIBSY|nr:GDSL esterase/lipase At4g10955-like [Hibiscus syriacus]XP_039031321.1 GDSL esterase/lipase At4g10955-like [Hibiscus syriacus]KAE8676179.1 GDSL esterase/lipase [Hibiscus syriacus]
MEDTKHRKKEKPTSSRQIFCLSGPLHLTSVDWNNFHDRRSVAASLVQGVYILERDRQQNHQDPLAHAPPWWDFFNFHLVRILVDDVDNSIFGAIYEYKFSHFNHNYSAQNSPHYVIAFQGTITKSNTRSRDLKLDFLCVRNRLHESSRFQLAMQTVESIFVVAGNSRIWLTGHSLGSAISLLIGKNMTKMGYNVEAYLSNSPFLSAPVEGIKNEKLKHGIHFTSSVVKAGLAVAVKGRNHRPDKDDPFSSLSSWKPYLFVNPADFVCSGYIGYFEHRKTMEKIGAGKIEKIATQNSMGNLLSSSEQRDFESLHLIPSAYLTINLRHSPNFKHAHGIHQWWDQFFISLSELHEYDPYVADEKLLLRTLHDKKLHP